jgi:hypothetical protein
MSKLTDIQFKISPPPVPLAAYQVALKYEDGSEQHTHNWMVEIEGERFEVRYTTTVQVLNSHKRKNKRLITVRQDGYLRKL